jgi:hypothetical protein
MMLRERRTALSQAAIVGTAAVILGGLQATGQALIRAKPWWAIVIESAIPLVAQSLFLLAALGWAIEARFQRVPRWMPLALAAIFATLAAAALDWGLSYGLRTAMGTSDGFGSDYVSRWWTESASLFIIGALAAFGAANAADATRRGATLRKLQLERSRLARRAYEVKLAALQARVEPRFLFDTLSDVEKLYERDTTAGARMLDELIVYLRAALPAAQGASSSLRAELDLVRTWLAITSARDSGRLTFALPDGDAPLDARLPPMLLLPLVQHAAEAGGDATRAVLVSAERSEHGTRITVIGPSSVFIPDNPSPAVEAVLERLVALYGNLGRLTLQSAMHDRSRAVLEIPYEPTDRHRR